MPGQPVVQQPVQVQAVPAQGHMPVNINTGKKEKEWNIYTPTPAEWVTTSMVLVGLLCWMASFWVANRGEDPSLVGMWFWQGAAYALWFGAVGNAAHSIEKALLNSKK